MNIKKNKIVYLFFFSKIINLKILNLNDFNGFYYLKDILKLIYVKKLKLN